MDAACAADVDPANRVPASEIEARRAAVSPAAHWHPHPNVHVLLQDEPDDLDRAAPSALRLQRPVLDGRNLTSDFKLQPLLQRLAVPAH